MAFRPGDVLTPFVTFWIWISALASAAGWLLSAVGQLNRTGYVVFGGVTIVIWIWMRRRSAKGQCAPMCCGPAGRAPRSCLWKTPANRFRRFLPLSFAVLSLLVLLGGLLYAPSNHTGLSYRLPRVLSWLAEDRWHWIHTPNYRMNNRACGIEWLSAPLLLFTKSDRGLFLLNFLPFLMLPGLIFSLFTRLGVQARVAWRWMWLLPTGYTFLVQAGSIGNDTFPTVYALAALDFALRARASGRGSDVYLSILSAALLTGAKASNLPLLLPWSIAMLGVWRLLLARPLATALVGELALLVSFLPTAVLNVIHCGDWSGLVLERTGMDMKNPFVGVWGNALLLLSNNFVPPAFPMAGWYEQHMLSLLPGFIAKPMVANFEEGFQRLWELPTEDWTGLGFGVSALVLLSVIVAGRRGFKVHPPTGAVALLPGWLRAGVLLGSWVALLAYCAKSGMVTPARLISPFYPFLIAPLLLSGQGEVIRRNWWRVTEVLVVLMAVGVLVMTPARPLWPAQTVLAHLAAAQPNSRLIQRGLNVYSSYSKRADVLAAVRALLPPETSVVGFVATEDDLDVSLWRPYGARKVKHFTLDDPVDLLRRSGAEYVVLGGFNLARENKSLAGWLQESGGELVGTVTAEAKVREGPQAWYVVRMGPRLHVDGDR